MKEIGTKAATMGTAAVIEEGGESDADTELEQ